MMGNLSTTTIPSFFYPLFLNNLLSIYWLILIAICISIYFFPFLAAISHYGKNRPQQHQPQHGASLNTIQSLLTWTVPKSYFLHFYITATLFAILMLSCISQAFILIIFFCHSLRRLYESLYISVFSKTARMHITGYLLGISFYPLAILTLYTAHVSSLNEDDEEDDLFYNFIFLLSGLIFLLGSYQQHQAHQILANLRRIPNLKKSSGNAHQVSTQYSIPYGGWFQYVSCPHFFAEILIYTSFLIKFPSERNLQLMWIFVCLNLALTAKTTHQWCVQYIYLYLSI